MRQNYSCHHKLLILGSFFLLFPLLIWDATSLLHINRNFQEITNYQYSTLEHNKAAGSIIGAAVGDALGRNTEFQYTQGKLRDLFPSPADISLATYAKEGYTRSCGTPSKQCIIYTDDTVMAKVVLEQCLAGRKNGWTNAKILDNIAKQLIFWTDPHNDPLYGPRAHGPTNTGALDTLKNISQNSPRWWDRPIPLASTKSEGGCGSVMRVAPIGLIFSDNLDRVKELAKDQSLMTHRHPMAQAACVAMAIGVALAYQGKSIDKVVQGMYQAAADFDSQNQIVNKQQTKQKINVKNTDTNNLRTLLSKNVLLPSDMILYAAAAAYTGDDETTVLGENNKKGSNYRSPSGALLGWAADEAVAAAVYLFVKYANNPNGLWLAIQNGAWTPGDSDSIASLAGALIGAYKGFIVPESERPYLPMLENYEQLLALAEEVPPASS